MSQPRLSIARIATDTPMGAQAYEAQVIARAAEAMGPAWSVRELVFRSMRSPLPGNRRLPLGKVARAPASVRRALGRTLFRGDTVSHRTSLELPPSPHADVITLHDVVAWRFADESAPVPAAIHEARRASAVICVSEFTANEAVEFLGVQNPHVVPNGVDPRYLDARPLGTEQLSPLGLNRPYVLHAGGAAARKNLPALAEAWPRVHRERPDWVLALAGPAHPTRTSLFEGMPGTVLLGRLPDELMPGVMASASVVVVPSVYEGFGLPVLEAMAAGVPVVAANTSSLPEVASGHALLVEPTGSAMAAGLIDATSPGSLLARSTGSARAHAAEFTWERSAQGHAAVWASLL
ncbi:glycosyltransferase family 4 protein [Microbacterium esteraromaticum]|uniref:Glycosyltransferase family 4 protein n=1 Tax=Microbacterium esteraromaticum TaxID=57043 RepID=A0A939DWG8_9MICO|nr:glycosyltransferase family 1 protein [Microbacterium esteraromaticum]MBN8205318.1 glycosyltransferase family 4 protein [Microbacterium esteraromaticum]MBN8415472.1 glycosyltransferase family 4 protein [Microbacterium esteraromaticum]MBN8424175.1 glycosyltransferase family 4 protein [Microbacterium esteraromaticum]